MDKEKQMANKLSGIGKGIKKLRARQAKKMADRLKLPSGIARAEPGLEVELKPSRLPYEDLGEVVLPRQRLRAGMGKGLNPEEVGKFLDELLARTKNKKRK